MKAKAKQKKPVNKAFGKPEVIAVSAVSAVVIGILITCIVLLLTQGNA